MSRSLRGDVEVRLTFRNETNEKVDIFWLDYEGNPVEYEKDLPPGGTYSQDTYETHPWIAKMSCSGAELFLDNEKIYQPKARQDGAVQTVLITVPVCKSNEARSLRGDVEVRLTFQNETNGKVDIFWLDYEGNPVEYEKDLPPGGTYSQDTYETHPWIAKMSCSGAELFLDNASIYQPKARQDGAVQTVLITVPVSTCFVDGGHGTSTTVYTTCVHPASVGKES